MKRFKPFRVICIFTVVFFTLGNFLVMGAEKIPRIAVLEIKNLQPDKNTDWIGAATAETLSGKLCGVSSISVVERRHIQDIINEQKLQLLGPTDLETAVEVGKLVGADVVVVGSYISYAEQVQFNVRFVDVETGEVRNAASLTGKMSEIFQLNYKLAEAAIESLNKRIVIIEGAPVVKEVSEPKKVKLSRKERELLEKQGTTSRKAYKYFGRALESHKAGKSGKAIKLYTRAVQLDPNYSWAYICRGVTYYNKGDYDRAIADYNQTLEINPKYALAYNNRGVAYEYQGDYDRAIDDYNRALEINPKYALAYYNRGVAYYKNGDYDRAIDDYKQALEINPKDALAYNNRGVIYEYQGDYDRAIADYNQTLEINPKYALAYNNRGNAYYKNGDYDRAIADYNQTLEINPKYALAYNNRGNAYYKKGDYDRAIDDCNRALEINPNCALAYYTRGKAYYKKGEYKKAWKDIQHCQDIGGSPNPDFVRTVKEKLKGSRD